MSTLCETCDGKGLCKSTPPGNPHVICPSCTPRGRWEKFTDQELGQIREALRRVGTVEGSKLCGEIAYEQAVRK